MSGRKARQLQAIARLQEVSRFLGQQKGNAACMEFAGYFELMLAGDRRSFEEIAGLKARRGGAHDKPQRVIQRQKALKAARALSQDIPGSAYAKAREIVRRQREGWPGYAVIYEDCGIAPGDLPGSVPGMTALLKAAYHE